MIQRWINKKMMKQKLKEEDERILTTQSVKHSAVYKEMNALLNPQSNGALWEMIRHRKQKPALGSPCSGIRKIQEKWHPWNSTWKDSTSKWKESWLYRKQAWIKETLMRDKEIAAIKPKCKMAENKTHQQRGESTLQKTESMRTNIRRTSRIQG